MLQEKLAGIMLLDSPAREGYKEALDAVNYFSTLKGAGTAQGAGFNGANQYGMVDLICFTNQAARKTGGSDIELTPARLGEFPARLGEFPAWLGEFPAWLGEFPARLGEFPA
jgi:hypothetical protein